MCICLDLGQGGSEHNEPHGGDVRRRKTRRRKKAYVRQHLRLRERKEHEHDRSCAGEHPAHGGHTEGKPGD